MHPEQPFDEDRVDRLQLARRDPFVEDPLPEVLVAGPPRDQAVAVLHEVEDLAPRIHPLLHVSEIRTMAADDLWLSGAYGRDTVGIHFTWQRRPEVLSILADLDAVFAQRGGRPHWGKLYDVPPRSMVERYPRFGDFATLVGDVDPTGTFRNRTLDALLSPS